MIELKITNQEHKADVESRIREAITGALDEYKLTWGYETIETTRSGDDFRSYKPGAITVHLEERSKVKITVDPSYKKFLTENVFDAGKLSILYDPNDTIGKAETEQDVRAFLMCGLFDLDDLDYLIDQLPVSEAKLLQRLRSLKDSVAFAPPENLPALKDRLVTIICNRIREIDGLEEMW